MHALPDAAAGHYQKQNLAVESVAVKLTDQRIPEKPNASFLTQALAATLSAITSFTLTTVMGLGYVFVRRYRRPAHVAAIQNTLAAVSIPMTAIPTTEAQSMSNQHKLLVDATVVNSGESMTAEDSQYGFYESEILEHGFSRLTQGLSSVAGIFANKLKKLSEQRFTKSDVPRKVRLKQIEHRQAQHSLQTLVDTFIANIEVKLKKTTHVNPTEWIGMIVRHLMNDYREYLNDSVSELGLTQQVDEWFASFITSEQQQFLHDQKVLLAQALTSSSFSGLLNHLFMDKVCNIYQDRMMIFSENQELAEQQKRAVLKIMPSLLQSEQAFVASLSVSRGTDFIALAENNADKQRFELSCQSKQSIGQKYLPNSGWVFNYFKPVKATEIEKTLSSNKRMQQ